MVLRPRKSVLLLAVVFVCLPLPDRSVSSVLSGHLRLGRPRRAAEPDKSVSPFSYSSPQHPPNSLSP